MKLALRALAAHFRAHLAIMFQYRGEVLLWSIWGIVNPAVLYAVWGQAASSHPIAGYDRAAFAAYFLTMMIVGHFTSAWDVYQMGYLVRTGTLSPQLLEPVLPMWRSIAENVAYKIVTLMFVIPMWIVFAWFVSPRFQMSAFGLTAGILALLLGAALAYMLGYAISMAAFWAPKIDALGEIYFGLCLFLGGRFVPIDALPAPVAALAKVMPFRWMYEFPAELIIGGRLTHSETLAGFAIQIGWLALTLAAFRILWRAGMKRYTAVSG